MRLATAARQPQRLCPIGNAARKMTRVVIELLPI
jgi:hypothetical protein